MKLSYANYSDNKEHFSFLETGEKEMFKQIGSMDFFGFQKIYLLLETKKIELSDLSESIQQQIKELNLKKS